MLDVIADSRPSSPAVFYQGDVLSYGDLRQQAREAARGLLALGVTRGDRVGVLLGNQPEWLVMCFAAAYVGATFVPLNTWYKRTELAWTLRHCELSILVFAPRFINQNFAAMFSELIPDLSKADPSLLRSPEFPRLRALVALGEDVPGTMRWTEFLSGASSVSSTTLAAASARVAGEDFAFILYTSGSLAEPKGVLLNHRSALENGFDMGERRAIIADDRIWLGSPLFYGLGATNAL